MYIKKEYDIMMIINAINLRKILNHSHQPNCDFLIKNSRISEGIKNTLDFQTQN